MESLFSDAEMRAHPAFDRCFRIYRNALADWHGSVAIQDAAFTLGMNARSYADSRLAANQFSWASSTTGPSFSIDHANLAYRDAVDDVCGVKG